MIRAATRTARSRLQTVQSAESGTLNAQHSRSISLRSGESNLVAREPHQQRSRAAANRNPATGPASEMRIWLPRRAVAVVARGQAAEAVERDPRMAAEATLHERVAQLVDQNRNEHDRDPDQRFGGSAGPRRPCPATATRSKRTDGPAPGMPNSRKCRSAWVGGGSPRSMGGIENDGLTDREWRCGCCIIQSAIRNPQSEIAPLSTPRRGRLLSQPVGKRIVRPQRRLAAGGPARPAYSRPPAARRRRGRPAPSTRPIGRPGRPASPDR